MCIRDRFGRVGLARGRSPVHTLSRMLVARSALGGVEEERHPVYPEVSLVTLLAGQARLTVPVPAGSGATSAVPGLALS